MITPLTHLDGVAAGLAIANVDTDMILPARFMKTMSRTGLGRALLYALRHDENGCERPEFILNRAPWRDAIFLVGLDNFGCGSSREHAPWALLDFGIRCIIAPSFADIFANNCAKNGILTLTLDQPICELLLADVAQPDTARLRLDLPAQTLTRANGEAIAFTVPPERKRRLIEALDDIRETLCHEPALAAHDRAVAYPRPTIPTDVDSIKL